MSNNHLAFSGMEVSPENCYFQSNWDDPNDPFESALSSMVSSPTSNGGGLISGDGMMMRELIGRLGSICESGEISPQSCIATANNTPLNSPPTFNLSPLSLLNRDSKNNNYPNDPPSLAFFNNDPGFAERAAKFSSFGGELGISNRSGVNSQFDGYFGGCQKKFRPENGELMGDSREGSSVSEQNPVVEIGVNSRKRKSIPKAKVKDSPAAKIEGEEEEGSKTNGKRRKRDEEEINRKSKENKKSNNKDSEEPLKDYIHVRARRGQATDSHSLAERVRREKISERMKFLQDLVPGCNKVTGKASVLDEIINYVQSLQGQVEFLSMKLATVNPRIDFNTEPLLCNDMFECRSAQTMYPLYHNSTQAFPSGYQPSQHILPNFVNGTQNPFSLNPAGIHRIPTLQLPSIAGFSDPLNQMPSFWEDDLPSIMQIGIAQNQTQPGSGMKVEE